MSDKAEKYAIGQMTLPTISSTVTRAYTKWNDGTISFQDYRTHYDGPYIWHEQIGFPVTIDKAPFEIPLYDKYRDKK